MMTIHETEAGAADVEEGLVRNDQAPNAYIVSGEWPSAELSPDAPIGAHVGQEIARRLKAAMETRELTHRGLAERSGLGWRTVGRVLLGDVYPDVATLARLEQALDIEIYPTRWHRQLQQGSSES
ncbi:helix-turn-helix transcriptional regulator [Nonomuraea sp. NPDC005650]|uniref:helix-turn-helix domain-containing protein n=1 Tax=Nonomuraea sp. NPDC005650 TaxID=3157045 RepID=UPI0033AFD9B5